MSPAATPRVYLPRNLGARREYDHALVSCRPERYVFAEPRLFDTVYHLTREDRAVRTARVIEDLRMPVAGLG
jgi:hypothetical protein